MGLRQEYDAALVTVRSDHPHATVCAAARLTFDGLKESAHWPPPLPNGMWSLEKLRAEATVLGLDTNAEAEGYLLSRLADAPDEEANALREELVKKREWDWAQTLRRGEQ